MAGGKEIRTKIKSVQNTRKITKAMQMVAASKMRRAQDQMRTIRPYGEKIRQLAANLAAATTEEEYHPFLVARDEVKRVGVILVTTDKGLCGGLNTNVLRLLTNTMRDWEKNDGIEEIRMSCIGSKGLGFMQRIGANIVSQIAFLGDSPQLADLIGPVAVLTNAYREKEIDKVYLCYTRFINTMKQEPVIEQLLPISGGALGTPNGSWDYIYEPSSEQVVHELLVRYIDTLVYQSVAENGASEQSARMVAMKAATDNAGNVIKELQLVYNKARQAAITKEISEIVGGAAAISG